MRTGPLAAAGWVVAATLTLGVSWSAMQAVRTAVAPEGVEVSATDALPPPPETTSSSPTSTAPRPTATAPAVTTLTKVGVGGTVTVRCVNGVPELVRRMPKQGFTVDVDDSPGEVKFTSGSWRTEMKASCVSGKPAIAVKEDDRGGGDDDDNSGRGGGDDNSGPGGGGNSGRGGGDDD